jgi:hypothetical protein
VSFFVSITQVAPPWLLGTTGKALLQTIGQKLDAKMSQLKTGIKARWPDYAPSDALAYIGNDRNIEQGPNEPAASFQVRLRTAVAENHIRGSAASILDQLAAYFTGNDILTTETGEALLTESGEEITTES